jgi:hypothetical protein
MLSAVRGCAKMRALCNHRSAMLRNGNQVRLTRPERARLARITAIEPGTIRSVEDLQAYVRRCKAHYWRSSDDTRFLHWLIDREVQSLATA